MTPCRCRLVCALLVEKTLPDVVVETLVARVPEISAVCEIQLIQQSVQCRIPGLHMIVRCVVHTLGDRELPKEFAILKNGGKLVSLRGMPNGEFAVRTGMPAFKRMLLKFAGRKYDQMAAKKNQKYYFIFVHEDGAGLERISEIFAQRHIEASVDEVFALEDVNKALKKVAGGKSKGKTVIKVNK